MHRLLITASVALAASALAAAASATGAYERRDAANAEACARACEDDRLCQAWAFADGACDMMAAAPADMNATSGINGFSSRAPQFLRERTHVAQAPLTPVAARLTEPTPPASAAADSDPNLNADYALLGGPDSGALRQRLPN